jgi:dTDP-4-dehydrorhamnose 3,5-epimerase
MIETCQIEGLLIITPKRHGDERGHFSETYKKVSIEEAGFKREFIQDNQSLSSEKGVVRGLHFQTPPFAQDKLVRVLRGAIFDVAVDLRSSSATYGRYFSIELSAKNGKQLLIPIGFAHGLCTLEPHTEIAYKVSDYYAPDNDAGLMFDDPDIGIAWPLQEQAILSQKDQSLPFFKDFISPF